MRPYEVMVIFDVGLEEGDIRQRVDRVQELVRTSGGTPGSVSHWGRRTFAYEIQHKSEGYYVVLEATAEPATMSQVDRFLALEDAVLRHKVIRQPDHVAGRAAAKPRRRPAPGPAPAGRSEAPRTTGRSGGGTVTAVAPSRAAAPASGDGSSDAVGSAEAPIAADAAETAGTEAGDAAGAAEPTAS